MPSEEEMSSNDQDDFGYFERFRNMPIEEIKPKDIEAAIVVGGRGTLAMIANHQPERFREILNFFEIKDVDIPKDDDELKKHLEDLRKQGLKLERFNLKREKREITRQKKK